MARGEKKIEKKKKKKKILNKYININYLTHPRKIDDAKWDGRKSLLREKEYDIEVCWDKLRRGGPRGRKKGQEVGLERWHAYPP